VKTQRPTGIWFRQHAKLALALAVLWAVLGHVAAVAQAEIPTPKHAQPVDGIRVDSGLVTVGVFFSGISVTAAIIWRVASERQHMRDRMERHDHEIKNLRQMVAALEHHIRRESP